MRSAIIQVLLMVCPTDVRKYRAVVGSLSLLLCLSWLWRMLVPGCRSRGGLRPSITYAEIFMRVFAMPNEKKRAAVERAEQRLALAWKKQNEVLADGVRHPLLLACHFPSGLAGSACHFPSRLAGSACDFPSGLAGSSLYHRHSCSPLLVDSRVNALLFADFAVAHGKSITFGNLSTRNLRVALTRFRAYSKQHPRSPARCEQHRKAANVVGG